jgi:hypothetical protein
MMRTIALWTIVAISYCFSPALGNENSEATNNYEKAIEKLKAGDLNVDFKVLRLNCAASKYSCEADSDDKKTIRDLLEKEKFNDALGKANKGIEGSFVDIDMHYFAFIANMELKREERAEFHKAMIRGLLDSIRQDKHGRSEEDAFEVINVHEEYVFLGFSNMRVKRQSLVHKGEHSFDVMECTDIENNQDITVYFNIDIPMKKLMDALQ